MKQKKKSNVKGLFAGGVALATQYATSSVNDLLKATNTQFDPNAAPAQFDPLAALKGGGIGLVTELLRTQADKNQRANHVAYATPGNYAAGGLINGTGDTALSGSAFQVKGNPGVTDGNYYPELNANLDHNEVVKDAFVYSTKLKTPAGKPFSAEAAKLEKSTGKAQKILMTNPNDPMAKNTIKMNEMGMASLAKLQETMATSMGLREGNPKGLAAGGPVDPPYTFLMSNGLVNDKLGLSNMTSQQWMDFTNPVDIGTGKRRREIGPDYFIGTKYDKKQAAIDLGRDGLYYDPYGKKFAVRNSRGEYVGVQPKEGQFQVNGSEIKDLIGGKSYNVDSHLQFMNSPKMQAAGPGGPQLEVPSNVLFNPIEGADNLGAFPYPAPSPAPVPTPNPGPVPTAPIRGGGRKPVAFTSKPGAPFNTNAAEYDRFMMEQMQAAGNLGNLPAYTGEFDAGPSSSSPSISPVTSTSPARPLPDFNAATKFGAGATAPNPVAEARQGNPMLTVGDGLQALTVASKFGQLQGGAEKEKPYYDTTAITRETFDPTNSLADSNRQFQQGLNTLRSGSINQGRAMANSLYAGKMNQDFDIRSKYDQLNKSAVTQQETRQAEQRRYNIGQTVGTNDINARNRAAYKEAVDVAFNSLGNLGKGLNEKKTAYDSLGVLQKMYPEVYARIMGEQAKTKSTNG